MIPLSIPAGETLSLPPFLKGDTDMSLLKSRAQECHGNAEKSLSFPSGHLRNAPTEKIIIMDRWGFEPQASAMPRRRSTAELPALEPILSNRFMKFVVTSFTWIET